MYWTSLGATPSVYHSHMDGGNVKMMENVVVGYPTGIAIDYQHDGRLAFKVKCTAFFKQSTSKHFG